MFKTRLTMAIVVLAYGLCAVFNIAFAAGQLRHNASLAIIEIDDDSLRRHGGWPLPISIHARLLEQLALAGASGALYNVIFVGTYAGSEMADFHNALTRLPIVVFPTLDGRIPSLLEHTPAAVGELAITPTESGVVSEVRLVGQRSGGLTVVALSACAIYGIKPCTFRSPAVQASYPRPTIHRLTLEQVLAGQSSASSLKGRFAIINFRFSGVGSRQTVWGNDVSDAEILAVAIVAAANERVSK